MSETENKFICFDNLVKHCLLYTCLVSYYLLFIGNVK